MISAPERRPAAGAGTLALVAAAITGIVTSMTMIGPLLVDVARDLGISLGQAGLLAAAAAVPQALGSPFAGLLSDRVGRRPLIVLALGGLGVLGVAAALAPNFFVLIVLRSASGLVGALAPTSLLAAIGELFPAERQARAMGWFNLGFSFAAMAGVPLMGAVGGALGWRWAFAAIGVALLLVAVGAWVEFPALPPLAAGTSVRATYRAVWGVPGLLAFLGANLTERSLFLMATIYLPAVFMLRYQLTAVAVAPVLSLVAVGTIAGNVLGGWLGDRLARPGIFVAAQLVAGTLGLVLFGTRLALAAAVALATAFALANAASRPAFLAYGSQMAPGQRGALFGLLGLTNQGGFAIGSALGAAVIGGDGRVGFALVTLCQGVLAAGLALPLLWLPRRRGDGT